MCCVPLSLPDIYVRILVSPFLNAEKNKLQESTLESIKPKQLKGSCQKVEECALKPRDESLETTQDVC